jgi:hypothetical protein
MLSFPPFGLQRDLTATMVSILAAFLQQLV